ncbi:MAG: polymer-forming cytoskeletal protein [Deltaproteobacteria bacterium]|nr:polymer-forming cytoskeletal protein [Deltaproteobacteria bacterium]
MALFNKEADRNLKTETAAKFPVQPQIQPLPVTQAAASPNSAPAEKPATPLRPTPLETRGSAEGRAYLDSGSKISGKLLFEGATRIDGQVDGEITAKDSLVIGESAVVTAQIKANAIIVAGKISGDIIATQRLEIRPSARVIGNLTSPVLIVHEGAMFEGHCSMQPEGARDDRKIAVFPKEERLPQIAQKQA